MNEEGGRGERRRPFRWGLALLAVVVLAAMVGLVALSRFLAPMADAGVPVADVSSERFLADGSVVGFAAAHDTHAWLGIPFAAPPVGPLRFRAPRPPEAWADTRDALAFGPPCVQLGSILGGVRAEDADGNAGTEDCLYLNLWAPRAEAEDVPRGDARWPVMVWIHGGGNIRGWTGARMYDGARLAGDENVIVVSVAYRLGPFGWFSHPALRAEARDPLEASGNFGTLDQIAALEWVQSNIEEFGGDPSNVTIFGESAGALDVFGLLLVDQARGLFHRAIAQSGATETVSRAEAENRAAAVSPGWRTSSAEVVATLLEAAGIVPDREAAAGYAEDLSPGDLTEFLRSRDAKEILAAYRAPEDPYEVRVPKPIRDGALFPTEEWIDLFRAGRFARVPLLAGVNRDETKVFLMQDEEHVSKRMGFLYSVRDEEDFERRARLDSDFRAVRGLLEPLDAIAESGHVATYAYRFDWDEWPSVLGQDLKKLIGASHGFEMPLLFGTDDVGDPLFSRLLFGDHHRADRERLAAQMRHYWAEFARTGSPGRGSQSSQPPWPVYRAPELDAPQWMVLDDEAGGGLRTETPELSRAALIGRIDQDDSLSREERCRLYLDLFRERAGWSLEAFAEMGTGGCRDFVSSVSPL